MTKTPKRPRGNQKTYTRDLGNGIRLEAQVSPCVFMYPGYPLQLTVTLRGSFGQHLGQVHPADRTRTAAAYADADAKRLLAGVQVSPCRRCSSPAFDPATVETNRGGRCEACFLADLKAEWAKADEAERKEIAARDSRMKKEGMTVRVTAWVHHEEGDDYQVDWYLKARPTTAQVRSRLLKLGSSQTDDYQIINL